jgi:hypothetical protein
MIDPVTIGLRDPRSSGSLQIASLHHAFAQQAFFATDFAASCLRRTPWYATQRAAWEALKKAEDP